MWCTSTVNDLSTINWNVFVTADVDWSKEETPQFCKCGCLNMCERCWTLFAKYGPTFDRNISEGSQHTVFANAQSLQTLENVCEHFLVLAWTWLKSSALIWSPRFPDLTVPDFSLQGYLNSRVCTVKLPNLDKFNDQIRDKMSQIPKSMLENVYDNWLSR